MNKISYLANVWIGLPVYFLLCLLVNTFRMLAQVWRFAISETKEVYRSNRRAHNR